MNWEATSKSVNLCKIIVKRLEEIGFPPDRIAPAMFELGKGKILFSRKLNGLTKVWSFKPETNLRKAMEFTAAYKSK